MRILLTLGVVFGLSSGLWVLDLPSDEKKEGAAPAEKKEAPAAPAKPAAQDPSLGAIEGKVTFEGDLPEVNDPVIPPTNQDKAKCEGHVKQEKLILSPAKELKDVVVSVAGYKPAQKPAPRATTLDNKHCAFVPHVQATTVGSTLKVTNSDSFLHNTRGVLALAFNNAIGGGQSLEKPLKKPGWGVVSCDFHPWMQGHIWVFAHDLFAVTGPDGGFKIANIPPGEHEIELWHEFPVAPKKVKVKVEAGKTARLDVALQAVPKK